MLEMENLQKRRPGDPASLRMAAMGFLGLALAVNMAQWTWIAALEASWQEEADRYQAQIERAERTRDLAVEQLEVAVLQAEADKQARAEQAAAYEAAGVYRYVGECTITAYCPCEECCGKWADGLTATGLPAGPGIVAVDKSVIPLGSTVVIDGQRYLAADTGVTGKHVDICLAEHEATVEAGVRTAEVWVISSEEAWNKR